MRLRYALSLAAASLLTLGLAGSAMADEGYSAVLAGTNEIPANASPATGTGFAILHQDPITLVYTVNYNVTYSGLTANRTASHFHGPATTLQNAGVVFGIAAGGPTADVIAGTWNIDATNITRLQNGLLYFNVHSTNFPGGEIRGQIYPDATPARPTSWGRIKALYSK